MIFKIPKFESMVETATNKHAVESINDQPFHGPLVPSHVSFAGTFTGEKIWRKRRITSAMKSGLNVVFVDPASLTTYQGKVATRTEAHRLPKNKKRLIKLFVNNLNIVFVTKGRVGSILLILCFPKENVSVCHEYA